MSNFIVEAGVFRHIEVVGARCAAFVHFNGCFFDRVRLAGKIRGKFIVSPSASVADEERFYRGVEWAIDVRGVEFAVGTGLVGVPPALVRCTPGLDWLVTRRSAERADFNVLVKAPGVWASSVSSLLISGRESMIVFGPRGKTIAAEQSAEGIARCVEMGVMLPLA